MSWSPKYARNRALKRVQTRIKGYRPTYRGKGVLKGSGHAAGESWGEAKQIEPTSSKRKYSKNSPSFDEGVRRYKMLAREKALINKINKTA